MKIYISGKITGEKNFMQYFDAAENMLRKKGYDVINPARENEHLPEGTEWSVYMRNCIKRLCEADAIYMLDNYKWSKGAKLELKVAHALDMIVIMQGY